MGMLGHVEKAAGWIDPNQNIPLSPGPYTAGPEDEH
jgi:hypothetical protein